MSIATWLKRKSRPRRQERRHAPRPFAERFAANLFVKPLESRLLLSAATELTLDAGGNLVITGVADQADTLTIQADTAQRKYIITDPHQTLETSIAGATTSDDQHTIEVLFSAVSGNQISVNTLGGNDSLTIDFSAGNFGKQISYDGGVDGGDSLTLIGGPLQQFSDITHAFGSTSGAGVIDVAGNSQISYSQVEQVSNDLDANLMAELQSSAGSGDAGEFDATIFSASANAATATIYVTSAEELHDAIDVAESGSTIIVAAGDYSGDFVIDKSLTLLGANADSDPTGGGERVTESTVTGSFIIKATGDVVIDVVINGFEIHGQVNDPGADLTIENNIIIAAGNAIDISGANSALIHNNVIIAGGDGIFGDGVATLVTITDNEINSAGFAGIELRVVGELVTIQGNAITMSSPGVGTAIFLNDIGGAVLIGSSDASEGNTIGGSLLFGVSASELRGTFTAQNNEITGASEVGISVANFDGDALIEDNDITSTVAGDSLAQGIYASNLGYDSPAQVTVRDNDIDVMSGGIWVESIQGTGLPGATAVLIGVSDPDQPHTIKAGGRGILLLAHRETDTAMGIVSVENYTIESGGAGIELVDVRQNFFARGNKITAGFEAGIRVSGSTANVTIGGPSEDDANIINVVDNAGIAISDVNDLDGTALVTIQGNDIASDSTTSFAVAVENVDNLLFRDNEITTSSTGLLANNVVGDVTVANNVIDGDGVVGLQVTNVEGSVLIGGSDPDEGNTVDGLILGIEVGDSPNVALQNNIVSGSVVGIHAYYIETLFELSGNSVESAVAGIGTGIHIDGLAGAINVLFGSGNSIAGFEIGLLIEGTGVTMDGVPDDDGADDNTLNDLVFSGMPAFYITLTEGALVGREIDGTGVVYDGILGDGAEVTEGFDIEDKVVHAIDDASLGFIRVTEDVVYVTPDSFVPPNTTEADIQRGIDVASNDESPADTIYVKAGAYNGDLLIDRPLTLSGPNADAEMSPVTGTRDAEAEVAGNISVATSGVVVITGFTVHGLVATNGTDSPELTISNNIISAAGTAVDVTGALSVLIHDNQITSDSDGNPLTSDDGIHGVNIADAVTIQTNAIYAADRGIDLDQVTGGVLVADTTIAADSYGVFAGNLGSTFAAQGNTVEVTGVGSTGISVETVVDQVDLFNNTVNSLASGSQGLAVHGGGAGVTVQGNTVDVDSHALWLENVSGFHQIGGDPDSGEANSITSALGTGVLITGAGDTVNLANNQIVSGGAGVTLQNGSGDFLATGNAIFVAVASGIPGSETGILIDGISGNVEIGGEEVEGNLIHVTDAYAGIEASGIGGNMTIRNNTITSQSSTYDPSVPTGSPPATTSIYISDITGETTIQRNLLDGSNLHALDVSGALGLVTIGGLATSGSISVSALNGIEITAEDYLTPGIDAGVSTIVLMANQDGDDSEGFLQASEAVIRTDYAPGSDDDSPLAIEIRVGGTGDAEISVLQADGVPDPDADPEITITVTVAVEVGGQIIDARNGETPGDDANIIAQTAILTAVTGIGKDGGDDDIDTAIAYLTATADSPDTLPTSDAGHDISIDEADDIELGMVQAFHGSVFVNAVGLISIEDGSNLQSYTGKVSNAPPLLVLAEANPDDVILPGDPTQEVVGFIGGGDPAADGTYPNFEQGVNFTIVVTWADGLTSTLNLVDPEMGVPGLQAGDKLTWIVGEDGSTTTLNREAGGSSNPRQVELFIQRVFPLQFLQTLSGTEITATFVVHNDAGVTGDSDTLPKDIAYHIELTDANSALRSLNRTADLVIATALSEEGFGSSAPVELVQTRIVVQETTRQVLLESISSLPGQSNIYQQLTLGDEQTEQELAILYLVRVGPDGRESNRTLLPLSDLRDFSRLLERLRKAQIPSGLYRIYHQEPGLPPRKVLEFRKTGNTIGDPVREPGRGTNPVEEQPPAGQPQPAPAPGNDAERPADNGQDGAAIQPAAAEQVALALAESTDDSFTRAARLRRRCGC